MTVDLRRIELPRPESPERRALTTRSAVPETEIMSAAAAIVADVAEGGDAALSRLGRTFGGTFADGGHVLSSAALAAATAAIDEATRDAIETAIANVTAVHLGQRPIDTTVEPVEGVTVERVWSPLRSVGVYVPGGRATYPSSLIMGVVPARIAGVERIVVATPASPDGTIDPVVLAAASILGVDEVHAMGGAQAIGALAHGTETIRAVAKVVGPGGPWVTAAKLAVSGHCGIDLPAGPSEAAVVADGSADISAVAADVMCQAEHGAESAILLVVDDAALADAVEREMRSVLPSLARRDMIVAALNNHGLVVVAPSIAEGLSFVDEWAPEHLSLHTAHARSDANLVRNAGSVFVGHWTPEAAGDYATGANHILPTGGLARAHGPLSVEDFGSWRQIQTANEVGLRTLRSTIMALAHAEGLSAHQWSVASRLGGTP